MLERHLSNSALQLLSLEEPIFARAVRGFSTLHNKALVLLEKPYPYRTRSFAFLTFLLFLASVLSFLQYRGFFFMLVFLSGILARAKLSFRGLLSK